MQENRLTTCVTRNLYMLKKSTIRVRCIKWMKSKKKIKKQNQKPTIKNLKRKNVVGIVYSCAALYTRTPTHWMRAMFVWLLYDIVIACFTMLNTCIHTFKMSCKATTFAINSNKRALLYCTFYVSTKKIKKSKSNTHRIKFAKWNLRAEWIEFYAVPQIMSGTYACENETI